MSAIISFENLVNKVESIHSATSSYAKGAVNQLLTLRNWMIGYYIVEYEQHGQEYAEYGTSLLKDLAKRLGIKGLEHNQLNLCRMFYIRYPQIFSTVSRKLKGIGVIEKLQLPDAPCSLDTFKFIKETFKGIFYWHNLPNMRKR